MASPWHYLPVEVPAGTAALRVTLSYSRDGGAILDLGCFGPLGFGGWSGGARSSFVVSPWGATPGYLAGEVVAGLWQVDHPGLVDLLTALSDHHPDPSVARAARKAAFKARSA